MTALFVYLTAIYNKLLLSTKDTVSLALKNLFFKLKIIFFAVRNFLVPQKNLFLQLPALSDNHGSFNLKSLLVKENPFLLSNNL